MKKLIKILTLILLFSCNDNTQTTDEELPNELSLDWILLKRITTTNFNVYSCDNYDERDFNDLSIGSNCSFSGSDGNECGDYLLQNLSYQSVESCDGYELCENDQYDYNCCRIGEVWEMDPNGGMGWLVEIYSYYSNPLSFEYKLYWNDDLDVCWSNYDCDENSLNEFNIVIPSYFPISETDDCDGEGNNNWCEREDYFHPNCDTPIDTTMMIGNKSVLIEKMSIFDRNPLTLGGNVLGYITYLRNEQYLQNEQNDIDISDWEVVDYQIKE